MSQEETPDDGGGGILAGLLAPLRLPERTLEALDTLVEAVENLGPMRSELTRVREQTAPLGELLPALEHLEERLGTRLDSIHEVVAALENEESHLNATVADLAR